MVKSIVVACAAVAAAVFLRRAVVVVTVAYECGRAVERLRQHARQRAPSWSQEGA